MRKKVHRRNSGPFRYANYSYFYWEDDGHKYGQYLHGIWDGKFRNIVHITSGYWTPIRFQFFAALWNEWGFKTVTMARYHPQADGQVERFKGTMISRLRLYVPKHQKNWDTFVHTLWYAYTVQVYLITKLALFSLTITRLPSGPAVIAYPISPDISEVDSHLAYRLRLIRRGSLLKKDGGRKF